MKKGTLIIWVIIFGFMALVIFQNKAFFLESKTSISLNLGISEPYQSPELANAVIVLFFFICGIIIAYLFNLSFRFKAKRSIKKLNATVASDLNELSGLKSEINKLKSIEAPVDEKADTVKLDLNATQKVDANSPADKTVKIDAAKGAPNPGEVTREGAGQKKEK
jgi:cell division protein FtsL